MKKGKRMKKVTTVLLTMAIAVSLVGCGSGDKSGGKMSQKEMKELVYQAEVLGGMDQLAGDVSYYAVKGDDLYVYTTEWIEEKNPAYKGEESDEPGDENEEAVAGEEARAEDAQEADGEDAKSEDTDPADANAEDTETGDADAEAAESEDTDPADAETEDTESEEAKDAETEDAESEDAKDTETEDANAEDTESDGAESEMELSSEEEYTYTTNQYFYKLKTTGSEPETIFSNMDCGEQNEWLNNFCIAETGDIYMLYSSYDPKQEKTDFSVHILDSQGKEKDTFSLADMLGDEETYVQTMCMDEENDLYLLTDKIVYVVAPDGTELFQAKMDGWASGMTAMNDGQIVVSTYGEEGMELKVIDKKAKAFGKTYKMSVNSYGGNNSLIAGKGDYSFYYNDNSNLCGYNVETEKSTEILNWVSSNISNSNVNNIIALDDGNFLCNYYDTSMGEDATNKLYLLKKVDPSEVADKTIITYAGMYVDDQIKNQAVRFNKEQDKYQIVIKDYSNSEDAIKDMNADLLAGDIPDIIDLANLNVDKYITKGMLTDLYTFMENDPDIHKEDFLENILKLMETDGKLYRISPTIGIGGLVGRAKDLEGLNGFTIDDMISLEQKYGKDAKAFNMSSNTGVLASICSGNYNSYVDWNTGKCNFDSEDFIKLLEYANTYPKDEDIDWDNYSSLPTMIREKKCIFAEIYNLGMEEVELYDEMFGEEITFVGYPSDTTVGPAVNLNFCVGIYSKTANPDGAWAFLKTFLTDEYIHGKGRYNYGSFPLRKDSFEAELKKYSTKTPYTDEFGNEIQPLDSSWGYDDIEVKIGPLTDKQVEMVREVVASADHLNNYDSDILNIINEEAGAYFTGQKSAKEVADIIQNRVSTYVNENR